MQHGDCKLHCDVLMDPPHRFWNSEKLGLMSSGAWEAVLLTSIPYQVNDGPWLSSGFHDRLQQAKEEYLAMTTADECPLLAHLLPFIASDKGKEQEAHTAAFRTSVWQELQEASQLSSKGPKPALCRWYSWVDSHSHWKSWWHQRLLLFDLWGLGAGVVTRGIHDQSFRSRGALPPPTN